MSYSIGETIGIARVFVSLGFLFYASWSDFKKREVENWVWLVFAPLAFTLTFTGLLLLSDNFVQSLIWYGFSFGITSLIAICLFYFGAFGGADAKAFMCIALALPSSPFKSLSSPVFPLTVFSNSVLLASLSIFYIFLRNLFWRLRSEQKLFEGFENESFWRKLVTIISGYKMPVQKLVEKDYIYPLEDVYFNSPDVMKRTLLVVPRDEERKDVVLRISEASQTGQIPDVVWASPGLPMIIFITLGLVVALVFGDIIWSLLGLFLG